MDLTEEEKRTIVRCWTVINERKTDITIGDWKSYKDLVSRIINQKTPDYEKNKL